MVLAALKTSANQAPPSHLQGPTNPQVPGQQGFHLASGYTWALWLSSHLGAHAMVVDSSSVSEPGSNRAKLWSSPPHSADLLPENVK